MASINDIKCSKHPSAKMKSEYDDRRGICFYCPVCRRNRERRLQNAALRELCGTSARAAREDMGL